MANRRRRQRWFESHRGAGYLLANGTFALVSGIVLLLANAPVASGWACLTIGAGVVLLGGGLLVAFDLEVERGPATTTFALVAALLLALMALYWTHPAEDLPRLLPGHDGDSQHLRVLHGFAVALIAAVALRCSYHSVCFRHLRRDD
jgi:hypothetical protein